MRSAQYGDAAVFFFDEHMEPEPLASGRGAQHQPLAPSRFAPPADGAVRLRAARAARGGGAPVDGGDSQRLALASEETHELTLRSRHKVARWKIRRTDVVRPGRHRSDTRDRRRLGVWVEVVR